MKPLILGLFVFAVSGVLGAQVSPSPGTYEAPLRLTVAAPDGGSVRYQFLDREASTWFPWSGPLVLDALPGETRTYDLRVLSDFGDGESATRDYTYSVQRRADPVATVQPEPGRYSSAITVVPKLPFGWKVLEGGLIPSFPRTLDAAPGKTETFPFEATGPSDQKLVWSFVVDRRDQEALSLDVVSPREGSWANAQILAVSFRGVDRVLWSYGDKIDPLAVQEYLGPVLLNRPGAQTVTVAAKSRADGTWHERRVTWTNGLASSPAEGWPTSGVRASGIKLPPLSTGSISWDEGRSWQSATAGFAEAPSLASRKVLAVQIKQDSTLFRYVYWLDARVPKAPEVEFTGGWNPRIWFSGAVETYHRVTWTLTDGKSMDATENLWGPSGSWKVPDGVVAARVRALGVNQIESPTTTVGFPATGWSTPTWEPWDQRGPQTDLSLLPLGGRISPRPGFWPVFEVSERADVAEPNASSPLLAGAFLPVLPWGSDRTLFVRFAWRDAAGLIGPATAAIAVRVDRVPPPVPEVITSGGQILVKAAEGEEEGGLLGWAVTAERVVSAESLTFQPYRGALDISALRTASGAPLWFHAQAQDRAGNSGPARLNVALPQATDKGFSVVQVDPDPSVGDSAVENGGVYPWPSFRLRALDQGRDLWVSVTDQASVVPEDWKSRLQPWTGVLSRSIARGERRSFLVYWNSKTTTGWLWAQPRTLTLTLDLSAPAPPVVSGAWPTAPLGSPWTLNLRPARSGDTLKYTYTLDGSLPPDPLMAGEGWPGTRSWDAPPLSRLVVRLRMTAVSVSGIAVEVPLGAPVELDRTVPEAVIPPLEPFTYRTQPFVVQTPPGVTSVVRYTLTTDGRLPEVPTAASPELPSAGLSLEGKEGESRLYRLRWRSFSASGVPGPATDAYGLLIDRSGKAPLPGSLPTTVQRPFAPLLQGLPPTGLSAAPVTLTADVPPGGVLRYELREGVGTPRPVSMESAPWGGPLLVDSGEGTDRSFAVNLRAFTLEGRPMTDEVSYQFRIDRSPPALPVVELMADSRRPEASLRVDPANQNPDETLHFRWKWSAFGIGVGESEWSLYEGQPSVFSAPEGALTKLDLEAFWQDTAGNRGPTLVRSLLIDQNVVYLASKGQGNGSRKEPFGNLATALDKARLEGKSVILVAAGPYVATRTLDLGGLRVYGGLSSTAWEATTEPGRSVWSASSDFLGTSLLESGSAAWSLNSVDLATSGTKLASAVLVRGAEVTVQNGTWTWSGSRKGWDQEGGSLDWKNVSLSYTAEPAATLLDWKGVDANIKALRVSVTGNQGGQVLSLRGSSALFQDLVVVSKRSVGFDGGWAVSDSRVTVDQARFLLGEGAERVGAFILRNTEATFWNTEVSLFGSSSNTGFQATSSNLELQKGTLSILSGQEFNQGFVLDGSQTDLLAFDVKIETGAYQGGFSVDGGTLNLGSSKVRLAGGGKQVWGGQFLSPVLVNLKDVSWLLGVKTPGELWKLERPWKAGSSVTGSETKGWQ